MEKLRALKPEVTFAAAEDKSNAEGSLRVVSAVSILGKSYLVKGNNKEDAFENAAIEGLNGNQGWTCFDKKQKERSSVVGVRFHNRLHTFKYADFKMSFSRNLCIT